MGRKSLKAGALLAPVPPVLVTVGDSENTNIITIGWCGILSTHPARTYISVRPTRHSHGMLTEGREFVINLAPASLAKVVDYCGIYTGKKVNKTEACGFSLSPSEKVAPPTINECPIALECQVCEIIPMGTHDVFIADIVSVSVDDKILDKDGRIDFAAADLLAYMHGEYFKLGESLGKFGFSTKKSEKSVKKPGQKKPDKRAKTEEKKVSEKPSDAIKTDGGDEKKPFYKALPRGKRNRRGKHK